MRILLIGPKWVGEWTESVAAAAKRLNEETQIFYYRTDRIGAITGRAERQLPALLRLGFRGCANIAKALRDRRMNYRLVRAARELKPDLAIILKGETISLPAIRGLKRTSGALVSWWLDDPFRYGEFAKTIDLFDRFYVFDRGCLGALEARGYQSGSYLPCACDPDIFKPQVVSTAERKVFDCTVGIVASYEPRRGALLGQLVGLDVGLWGEGWDCCSELARFPPGTWRGRRLRAADVAKVYNLAKICPNIHHPQTQIGGLNMRAFEISASEGFQLTDHVPGIDECFTVDEEVATYSTLETFRTSIDFYLRRTGLRKSIAARARRRALRDHTYERRLETILEDYYRVHNHRSASVHS